MSTAPTWWVIFHEPNPAQMDIVAVEPVPANPDARRKRLTRSGQRAYIVTAPNVETAGDIAGRVWAEELVATPARLAAANAYLTRKARAR
ncbi:hypothetical protein [Streptomyces sp. NPDC086787]|uniref:hypothetical protein n=1 Tax=Streptomyces sp. NPDC086787 TaxID=3365759 RepID=UPI00381B0E82